MLSIKYGLKGWFILHLADHHGNRLMAWGQAIVWPIIPQNDGQLQPFALQILYEYTTLTHKSC